MTVSKSKSDELEYKYMLHVEGNLLLDLSLICRFCTNICSLGESHIDESVRICVYFDSSFRSKQIVGFA